jgi:hypothetical protein
MRQMTSALFARRGNNSRFDLLRALRLEMVRTKVKVLDVGSKCCVLDLRTDICWHALSTILINMQQKLIGTVLVLLNSNTTAMPDADFASLLGLSESARIDAVATLAQQYQRFSTSAPISNFPTSNSLSPSGHGFCPGAIMLLEDNDPQRSLD